VCSSDLGLKGKEGGFKAAGKRYRRIKMKRIFVIISAAALCRLSFVPVFSVILFTSCATMGVSDKHALSVFRYGKKIEAVAYSPSGHRIIVAFGDSIALINSLTGKKLGQIKPAIDLETYPVVTTGDRRTEEERRNSNMSGLKQDDTIGLQPGDTIRFDKETSEPQEARIASLAFSPNGRRIAAVYFITDITSITKDWKPMAELPGGFSLRGGVSTFVDTVSENKKGSGARAIKIINTADGKTSATFAGHIVGINDVAYNPDGTSLATCSLDGAIKIWSNEGLLVGELDGHYDSVNSICYSGDGKYIFSGSNDKTVRAWDLTENKSSVLFRHETEVLAVAAGGNYITSGSRDGMIIIGDAVKSVIVKSFRGHELPVNTLAVSPDGQYLASGSDDNTVKLWDMAEGQLIYTFQGHKQAVNSVSFSPDSSRLVSGSTDGAVIIWNMKDFN
jgi:WD40 repeat protein